MRRNKNGIRLITLLTVLILLVACAVKFDGRLRVLLNNYGQSRAVIISNSVINQTVYDYLEQNKLKYTDLIKINTDALIGKKFVVETVTDNYTYHKFGDVAWRVYATDGETLEQGVEFEICAVSGNKLIAKRVKK